MQSSLASQPLISVIVAVYNGKKTLQQCIDSVSQQTYPNKELIVIDGASSDGTLELIQANQSKISQWISEPDTGIYSAWNKGLERINGDWVCFLGADDYFFDSDVLDKVVAQLSLVPEDVMVAYGKIMMLDADENQLYTRGQDWSEIGERFKKLMCIPHPGTLHKASYFKKHGQFTESFRIAGDYELLLRELKSGKAYFLHDLITVAVREGGVSTDPKNVLVSLMEIRKAQKLQGLSIPSMLWISTMLKVYIRMFLSSVLGEKASNKLIDRIRRCPGLSLNWTEKK